MNQNTKLGTLHLIPVGLSATTADQWLPQAAQLCAGGLTHYIAENAKTARAFLKTMPLQHPLQDVVMHELNARVEPETLQGWLEPLKNGVNIGLVSEAGCPAVADPGARAVAIAHQWGAPVKPWVGPSSILLALMASGLDGQRFAFHGYAPIKPDERAKQIRAWETISLQQHQTQLLIETPYRNLAMFETMIKTLRSSTLLCIASDLTGSHEFIRTLSIQQWANQPIPVTNDRPALFLFQAAVIANAAHAKPTRKT
jgi:16S rRNA (cytidine1402-2'-O)-methyltransferase